MKRKVKNNNIDLKSLISLPLFYAGVILLTVIIVTFLSARFLGIIAEQNRNAAIDACYKVSLYRNVTEKDKNVITTEDTIEPSLLKCLDLKNIK